jgi:putative redox protein
VGGVEVEVEYGEEAEVKRARKYDVLIKLPADLSDDQVEKLREIAHKCPVHRTLKGHVEIDDRIERMSE